MIRSGTPPRMASGRLRLHQEPRAVAERAGDGALPGVADGCPGGQAAAQRRALLSRWHPPAGWASHASLERIDGQEDPPPPPSGPGEGFGAPKPGKKRAKGDFRGIKLSNKTHRSSVDPDALLARKSNAHPAQPSYRFSERTFRCDAMCSWTTAMR